MHGHGNFVAVLQIGRSVPPHSNPPRRPRQYNGAGPERCARGEERHDFPDVEDEIRRVAVLQLLSVHLRGNREGVAVEVRSEPERAADGAERARGATCCESQLLNPSC